MDFLNSKLFTLSELSRLKLANILTSIKGQKNFIIEQPIIRSLDRICGAKWLKLYDVEKIFKLEDNLTLDTKCINVFVITSNLIQFKRVIDVLEFNKCIDVHSEPPEFVKYYILVIPKLLYVFTKMLEEFGLYGHVHVRSFMWQYIFFDKGLISLEIPTLFSEIYVDKNLSLLTAVGKSLYFLFDVVGKPKIKIAIGQHAQDVYKHIELFEKNLGECDDVESDFSTIIVMDRPVDYVSALLTNVTYTGLLGEVYKINNGAVETWIRKSDYEKAAELEQATAGTSAEQKPKVLFNLYNKNDVIFSEIKHGHISEVSDILGKYAKKFKAENRIKEDMDLKEIKEYVQTKLQNVTEISMFLSVHLQACEKIVNELSIKFDQIDEIERAILDNTRKSENVTLVEDYIIMENEYRSLRLICLLSLIQKLTWDEYNSLKLQYLHEYGYKLLYLFQNLREAGLLLEPQKSSALSLPSIGTKKDFYYLANKLKLIPSEQNEVNFRIPADPSYVFSGNYIPIIAQLLTSLVKTESLADFKSKLDLLNGTINIEGSEKPFPLQQRTILVVIIGGVTYAEIAACKLVERLCGCRIVLASNCLICANDLLSQCK